MERITKGIFGGFSRKVEIIVGANWRGKDIIRSIPPQQQTAPMKSSLTMKATLPTRYTGKEIRGWAYLNIREKNAACNSSYLGALTMI